MMRRIVLIVFLLLSAFCIKAQTPDEALLAEYLGALDRCDISTKTEEADFIIGSSNEIGLGLEVAYRVYQHFRNSLLMGDENVAVHIADRWILPMC